MERNKLSIYFGLILLLFFLVSCGTIDDIDHPAVVLTNSSFITTIQGTYDGAIGGTGVLWYAVQMPDDWNVTNVNFTGDISGTISYDAGLPDPHAADSGYTWWKGTSDSSNTISQNYVIYLYSYFDTGSIYGNFSLEYHFGWNGSIYEEFLENADDNITVLDPSTYFISTWNTSLISTGSSASDSISLPLESGRDYDFIIDWGDGNTGTVTSWDDPDKNHTYSSSGEYTIRIGGTIGGFRFNDEGDKFKILDISQWGDLEFGNNGAYFYGCSNLNITATDSPSFTGTTSLDTMFRDATNLNANISHWNTSSITDMASMFYNAINFNQDLDGWDTSNVLSMYQMFRGADSFNQNLSSWDTSFVTSMSNMFYSANLFNGNISTWDTSSVTSMRYMFYVADDFNQPLASWDTSEVTRMEWMFYGANSFNQPLNSWNVSAVTRMDYMFGSTDIFNQDLDQWDTGNVLNMENMFYSTDSFNGDISTWDVHNVTDMNEMFAYADVFNQNLTGWDTSNVDDMGLMFQNAVLFNGNISTWDTSSVTRMRSMFYQADDFNQNLSSWDTSSVTDMNSMFYHTTYFNGDISTWDVSNVEDMGSMFYYAIDFNNNISNWDTSKVQNMYRMFFEADDFNQPLNWDTSNVTDMSWMFYGTYSFNQPLDWDTHNVTDMSYMFYQTHDFNGDISNWNTSNVETMYRMFYQAYSFNSNISNWDTSNVQDLGYMFYDTYSFNQPLNWNAHNVINMRSMFQLAENFDQDLGNWNVSSLTDAAYMFTGVTLSTSNYDSLLIGWDSQIVQNNTIFSGGSSEYCLGASARQDLNETYNWTITDGGYDCSGAFFTFQINTSLVAGTNFSFWMDDAVDVYIDWGDTNIDPDNNGTGIVWHEYASDGIYNVSIRGQASRVSFWTGVVGPEDMLIDILTNMSDGMSGINSAYQMFRYADNLVDFTEQAWFDEVSSGVTDMEEMFYFATNFNGNISTWDTSSVTNIEYMFERATYFNQDISSWNTSSIEYMVRVFYDADAFNQNLTNWDTSNVIMMQYMFAYADNFNGNISGWDTHNVTDMSYLFSSAHFFNQPLNDWNTSNVQYMTRMFSGADDFNQDLDRWDTSNVDDMDYMFAGADTFNSNISTWDTSDVDDMRFMFADADNFNQDISSWNLSNVDDMKYMFSEARSFNQNLSSWDVSNVDDMSYIFSYADDFNGNISGWNTSGVITMERMFAYAVSFNQDLDPWDTSDVENMYYMFGNADVFNGNISTWDTGSVTDMGYMFYDAFNFNCNVSAWNTQGVTSMYYMFYNADGFDQDIGGWNVSSLNNAEHIFTGTSLSTANYDSLLIGWDNLTVLQSDVLFSGGGSNYCLGASARQDLNETYNWTITDGGYDCDGLSFIFQINTSLVAGTNFSFWMDDAVDVSIDWGDTNIDADNDGTGLVWHEYASDGIYNVSIRGQASRISFYEGEEDMLIDILSNMSNGMTGINSSHHMFMSAENIVSFTEESWFDEISSNVIDMSWMFWDANFFNQNLTGWDTSSVTNMYYMFYHTTSFNGNVSGWNTSNVIVMENMFGETDSFNQPLNDWDTGNVVDMQHMFAAADVFNQDISSWDTSNVRYMEYMFSNTDAFNQNLSEWNTSNVVRMHDMFKYTAVFNGNISGWDTHNVTDMSYMFRDADSFNQNISSWNTSNVQDMQGMFYNAAVFNGNISGWDTHNVTDMSYMFRDADLFNGNISIWDTSKVDTMIQMFYSSNNFNQDIGNWNTSSVTTMNAMFYAATSFDQDIGDWNISNVADCSVMFLGVTLSTSNYDSLLIGWDSQLVQNDVIFDGGNSEYCLGASARQDLNETYNWTITDGGYNCGDYADPTPWIFQINTSLVPGTNFSFQMDDAVDVFIDWGDTNIDPDNDGTGLFWHNYSTDGIYNISIDGQTSRISFYEGEEDMLIDILTNMSDGIIGIDSAYQMFRNAANIVSFTEEAWFDEISSGVTNMDWVFRDASNFNQFLNNWNTSSVTEMIGMFYAATSFNQNLSSWDTSNVTDMSNMFSYADDFNGNISGWNTSKVQSMTSMFISAISFDQDIGSWDVGNVEDMVSMFENADSFNQDLNSWNVSKVTSMYQMFRDTANFNGDISSWDTSSVESMQSMFSYAIDFNQNISDWNISSVTDMDYMFTNADSFNQNLSSWDTSNVFWMDEVFSYADNFNGNISGWNTSKVQSMDRMFMSAISFDQDIGSWDVGNVEDMGRMFSGANNFNQDLSLWNVGKVTSMYQMFKDVISFDQNIGSWNISNLTDATDMFAGVILSTANYNSLLIGWAAQAPYIQDNVTFSGGNSQYSISALSARNDTLLDTWDWVITDGGMDGPPLINIISPVNGTIYTTSTIWFNATSNEVIDTWIVNYNGTNITLADINTTLEVEEGDYTLYVYGNDSFGSWGSDGPILFSVDTVAPTINILSPTNTNYTTSTIWFNATSNEVVDTWIVNYNGTNITLADINTTLEVEDGVHNLYIYANDSADNWGSDGPVIFIVDTKPPSVTSLLSSPTAQGYGANLTISADIIDTSEISSVQIGITPPGETETNYSMSNVVGDTYSINFYDYLNGTYTYNIYALDSNAFLNDTESGSFDIYVDLSVQVRTVKDIYGVGEQINITDPPIGIDLSYLLDENPIYEIEEENFNSTIKIISAMHLDENRIVIEDIYDSVKEKEDIWSGIIDNDEYVRVIFEQNLTNDRDITMFPKIISGVPKIEIYEVDSTKVIAEFLEIYSNRYNKVYLTGLNKAQDTFDLKIIGGSIIFDHIIDPMVLSTTTVNLWTEDTGPTTCDPTTTLEASDNTYCSLAGIDGVDTVPTGWIDIPHISNIPDGAIITEIFACVEFVGSGSKFGDDASDRVTVEIGHNWTGSMTWQVYEDNSSTEIDIYNTEALWCWDVTSFVDTEIKAESVSIRLNYTEGGSNNQFVNVDYSYINMSYSLDSVAPVYSNIVKDPTTIYQYDVVTYNTTWSDVSPGLDKYIFSTNISGSWQNTTSVSFSSNNISTNTTTISVSPGTNVGWKFYANDSHTNMNSTPIQSYVVAGVVWATNAHDMGISIPDFMITWDTAINGYSINTNVVSTCISGDCTEITSNWSTTTVTDTTRSVRFACQSSNPGDYSATFDLSSTQDVYIDTLVVNCTVVTGITYTEYEGKGQTSDLGDIGLSDEEFEGLILDNGIHRIEWNDNVTLNVLYDLDTSVDMGSDYIFVNSSLHPSLNVAADITMDLDMIGYPKIMKDGLDCGGDCSLISWDTNNGILKFTVTGFSNYSIEEANQSKVSNNGLTNASVYVSMKTQFWNGGAWVDDDIVIDTASPIEINSREILKLDTLWNVQDYNSNDLSFGEGTYRVMVMVVDNESNILKNVDGTNLTASYNFTYKINTPPIDPTPIIGSVSGNNYTTEDLYCNDTIGDPDGDSINVSIRWYKNGILDQTIDYNNSYVNNSEFSATLDSTNTNIGDNWSCSMRFYDGVDYSAWGSSVNLTVLDSMCSPNINEDWLIVDEQICNNKTFDLGIGKIIIQTGGKLTLINSSNIAVARLELNTTQGDSVFIHSLNNIIIK